jgi:alkanesulfonate monooxygenase SsuD/methylene tetrahydromethanopterin reductase-like flavin-dependent oxidoreductase (luciferase family)
VRSGADVSEYHGEFVDFGPMQSWPKPVQQPSPRVLVGGTGAHVLDRVVRFGDGWMPYGMPVKPWRRRSSTYASPRRMPVARNQR